MVRRLRFCVPWSARWAAAVAVGLAAANGASAFFFKGWPGDGIPRERTLVPPGNTIDNPRQQPPEWPPEQPPWNPPPEKPPEEKPPGVPEPATAVLAAVGAGLLAFARRRLRRR